MDSRMEEPLPTICLCQQFPANASRNYAAPAVLDLAGVWVQVLYFKDDEGVESMIRFCSCTKSSYSPLQNLKQRESSKSCKSCGGKLPVDGRGAQQGSMLSNGGLELSSIIDPGLNWKKASNGRQRAVRRARTSFTGANGKNSPAKSLKVNKDLTDKDSKSTEDTPVSESEKVGVSILGRRFSDTVGSVPIKKRRFLLDHSRSPSHHSSSYSDDSGNVMERQTASYQGAMVNAKQHSLDVNSGSGSVFGQARNFGFEKTDHEGANEKICDAADFSGISILAAAACETNIGGELLNVECSLSKVHPLEVQGVTKENAKFDFSPHEKEEAQPHTFEDLVGRIDLPFEVSSSSALPSKESNEVKSDGSCNPETSVNSSQKVLNKTIESSSRDVRFHWDLNTAADAWESHEEVLNSDREASHMSKDADHNDKLRNAEPFMDQVGFGDTKLVSVDDSQLVDSRDNLGGEQKLICESEMKTEEKAGISNDNSPADSKESKPLFSNDGDSPAEELHLTHAKTGVEDVCEETKSLSNKNQSRFLSDGVVSMAAAVESSLCDAVLEEGKAEGGKAEAPCVNFHSKVETENSPSHLVSCDDAIVDHPANVSGSHREMDKRSIESGTDLQMEEIIHTSSPQDEKHEFLFVNPGAVETDGNSLVCHLAEKGSEVLADGNKCENMVTGCMISGANAHMNALDETYSDNADKSKEKNVYDCETAGVETKMDNTNAHNDDMDVGTNDFPSDDIGFEEVSVCKLSDITPGDAVPQPALSSQGACKNNTDGPASNPAQVSLENHLDSCYHPGASQNDADQAPGMEKVEFLGDDDSQYEDGEFREALANCWLDDGEEVETERVDYGSDRDTDVCDAVSDFSSVNRQVSSVGLSDACHATQYREMGMDSQISSRFFVNCTSLANVSDAGSGTRNAGTVTGGTGFQGNLRTSEKDSSGGNDVGDNGFFKEADGARRSNHSASFRKMSGWDRLPGGCRNSDNGVTTSRLGSINRNCNGSSSDPVDSINRAVGSSMRRDLSSRIERAHSSDISRRNDKYYVRSSRSNDRDGFNPQVERDRDDPRPIGRSGPSMHLQGRGRGDHWVDSSNHHGNNRHDSSGCYGSTSFSHHGSRNAAAAAVAKVESNGFVVAPDGTIVRAGGAGSAGHLTRRSAKPSSQNPHPSPMGRGSPIERERSFGGPGHSREMSPDRPIFAGRGKPGRYGPGMDSTSHREMYRGPVPDGIMDSSSMHHTISRRDHSFSLPHRRPLHPSRSYSGSPSRSRTRSPHRWASPRDRGDNGMNGGPGLRRRSRSPNFKPDARMGRPRAGFGEHIVSYASLSRNHTSPPHASRWIDGRKEAAEHFRDYECRRCPERSPPARVFSRGRRFDLMDSPGRLKPDEYCRPANSGRFPKFVGFGRGSRHDGKVDDRREHGDRYEMLHSRRQYTNDGNMKRLRYDDENGFMAQNPRPKSSEFQRRESPRAFSRSTERQLGNSPRRSK